MRGGGEPPPSPTGQGPGSRPDAQRPVRARFATGRRAPNLLSPATLAPTLLALGMGGLYASSLGSGLGPSGDVVKFQFVGHVLGTPHAPGYPLYVLALAAASHLVPAGSVAWRANLLSAVFAVLALLLLYGVLRRLGARPWVAAVAAAGFGLLPAWWSHAVVAEVYTLHLVFILGVCWLLLRWRERLETSPQARAVPLAALSLLALGFAHHLTILTLVPAVVAFVALSLGARTNAEAGGANASRLAMTRREWLGLALLPVLAAAPYAYLFWRTARGVGTYLETRTPDLPSLAWSLTGAQFRDQVFAFGPGEIVTERIPAVAGLALRQLSPAPVGPLAGLPVGGLLLAVVAGLVAFGAYRLRNPAHHALLAGCGLGSAAYALGYDIPDLDPYLLPAYAMLAAYAGLGLERLADRFSRNGRSRGGKAARLAPGALLGAATLLILGLLYAHHRPAVERVADIGPGPWLSRTLATLDATGANNATTADPGASPGAVVVAPDYLRFEALQYARHVGWPAGTPPRRDLWVVNPLFPDDRMPEVLAFLARHDSPSAIRRQILAAPTPSSLRAYLAGEATLGDPATRPTIPPDLPVYVLGATQRRLAASAGLDLRTVAPGVFLAVPPGS